jgi:hypothetical protein
MCSTNVSPAPVERFISTSSNTGSALSKSQPAGIDFFSDQVRKNPLSFECGKLGENARLRSRGEGHGSIDDVASNNRAQAERFLTWFFCHIQVARVLSEA